MDKITDDFSEIVKNKFGIYKIFLFLLILFIEKNKLNVCYKSFSEWLINQKTTVIKTFFEEIAESSIGDLAVFLISICIASFIYKKIIQFIIKGQSKQNDFLESIKKLSEKQKSDNDTKLNERNLIQRMIEKEALTIKEKINKHFEIGAFSFTLSLFSVYYYHHLGKIDIIISLSLFLISLYIIYEISSRFISDYSKIIFAESISNCTDIEKLYLEKINNFSER